MAEVRITPGKGDNYEKDKSRLIDVHICPVWFAKPEEVGVKKGDYFAFKVRLTQNGTPFWVMTPEELAR